MVVSGGEKEDSLLMINEFTEEIRRLIEAYDSSNTEVFMLGHLLSAGDELNGTSD